MIQTVFAIMVFLVSGFGFLGIVGSLIVRGGIWLEPRAAREPAKPSVVFTMLLLCGWGVYSALLLV